MTPTSAFRSEITSCVFTGPRRDGFLKERLFDLALGDSLSCFLTGRAAVVSWQLDLFLLVSTWRHVDQAPPLLLRRFRAFEKEMNELFFSLLDKDPCDPSVFSLNTKLDGIIWVAFQMPMTMPASTNSCTTSRYPFCDAICNRVQPLLFHRTGLHYKSHCNRLS